jgi:hypothetical protein
VHTLDIGGEYQWRKDGEAHLFSPETIHTLQQAVKLGKYDLFKKYSQLVNQQNQKFFTLRGLLTFKNRESIPIEEVEPIEAIMKRFKTGHELRFHFQRGPRIPRYCHESYRWQVEHWGRGRRFRALHLDK